MSTDSASRRYGTSIAPANLRLTQELANTIAHPRPPAGADLIGGLSGAQVWLDAQLSEWSARHDVALPRIPLGTGSLRQLHQLRDFVRALLRDGGAARPESGAADGEGEQGPRPEGARETGAPAIAAPLGITVTAGGSRLSPAGQGIAWLRGAVAVELHLADVQGERRRLKICRNDRCGVAFYDQSKNNSRAWHDVTKCGNLANVRAYRERRRAQAP